MISWVKISSTEEILLCKLFSTVFLTPNYMF